MKLRFTHLAMLSVLFVGCDKDDSDTEGDTDTDTDVDVGFYVEGTAVDLMAAAPAAEGLCVYAGDPTPAIAGGEMEILTDEATVGAAGAYSVGKIDTASTVGLLMLVEDCADVTTPTVLPTATGLSSDDYATLGDGDTISDYNIYSIDAASQATIQGGLALAGYAADKGLGLTGNLDEDGALLGFVYDAKGNPVDAATINSATHPVYYFTGKGFVTTGTIAAAGAMFVIPGGPIGNYTVTHASLTFESLLGGSQPGYAVIVSFNESS